MHTIYLNANVFETGSSYIALVGFKFEVILPAFWVMAFHAHITLTSFKNEATAANVLPIEPQV